MCRFHVEKSFLAATVPMIEPRRCDRPIIGADASLIASSVYDGIFSLDKTRLESPSTT